MREPTKYRVSKGSVLKLPLQSVPLYDHVSSESKTKSSHSGLWKATCERGRAGMVIVLALDTRGNLSFFRRRILCLFLMAALSIWSSLGSEGTSSGTSAGSARGSEMSAGEDGDLLGTGDEALGGSIRSFSDSLEVTGSGDLFSSTGLSAEEEVANLSEYSSTRGCGWGGGGEWKNHVRWYNHQKY